MIPTLSPILSNWISDVLKDKENLIKLICKFGSPLNIHNVSPFRENSREFEKVLKKYLLKYKIFFARKPNRSTCFVEEAKKLGIGIDVASFLELKQCLDIGVDPSNLVLTAAIKKYELMELAVDNNVLIIIDNLDELKLVGSIAKNKGKIQPVGIRLSGFRFNNKKSYSRFGFDIDDYINIFLKLGEFDHLLFKGFHFHLSDYSESNRAEAILNILNIIPIVNKMGFKTSFIDIGGGFKVRYLKYKREWAKFESELILAVQNRRKPFIYENSGLGFLNYNGEVIGKAGYYPYYSEVYKSKSLEKILLYKMNDKTVAELLNDAKLELRIEPGRSLLDQCGITITEVIHRKIDQHGDLLIGVDMNMTQLLSSSADFLVDPILLFSNNSDEKGSHEGYFTGQYCLERDLILKRKIHFSSMPKPGDLVCFVNTAGYMMHFLEAEAHQFPKSANLKVLKLNGKYEHIEDTNNKR